MEATPSALREIALPASIFRTLREELSKEAGPLPTIHALHHAGYEAGVASANAFGGADKVKDMAQTAFWTRLFEHFSRRGWGTLSGVGESTSVAMLQSPDWAEADPDAGDPEASCSFSTGFLSGLLTTLAGSPIAVLEVYCRSRGDEVCLFAFGSEQTIHDLYGKLVEGLDLDAAVEAL